MTIILADKLVTSFRFSEENNQKKVVESFFIFLPIYYQ